MASWTIWTRSNLLELADLLIHWQRYAIAHGKGAEADAYLDLGELVLDAVERGQA